MSTLYVKIPLETSTPAQTPSPCSEITQAIGVDTVAVFLHGLHTREDARIIKSESGTWHAINTRKGISLLIHASHGPDGRSWTAATGPRINATVAAAAQELAPHIVGGVAPTYLRNRIETARLSRLDVSWDLRAPMADVNVVAPRERYGEMREKAFATSTTRYWGKRGGYVKDGNDEYVRNEAGEKVYERPSAKELRVYDKSQQMFDTYHRTISERITRIEIQMNSNKTIVQNTGYSTLRDVIYSGTAPLRIRAVLDELCVSVRGERISPLTAAQMRDIREKAVFAKICRKIRRNTRRKEKQSTAKTNDSSLQDTLVLRAGRASVNIPVTPFSAYPPEVQDMIFEHIEQQERERQAEDDPELRWARWWSAVPEADRELIDSVIAGRVVSVAAAWDEALQIEAWNSAKEDAEDTSFYKLCMSII